MTLESVIEGIAKRCKATNNELVEWLKKRDERNESLEQAKHQLDEAVKRGLPESIKYWKKSVKVWKGHVQYAEEVIGACQAKETALFLLCKEIGLKYYDIVFNLGGAQ